MVVARKADGADEEAGADGADAGGPMDEDLGMSRLRFTFSTVRGVPIRSNCEVPCLSKFI